MYFIDVKGTLIDDADGTPIPGACEAIAGLNARRVPYMVVTNNTKYPSETLRTRLNDRGLAIDAAHYLDALMMLERFVVAKRVAAFGTESFLHTLQTLGVVLDDQTPDVVLLSVSEAFTSEDFARMIALLQGGAALVGMHETSLYVSGGRRYPGTGALLRMLAFATSTPYATIGKPGSHYYDEALRRLRMQAPAAEYRDITMISDDLQGDLVGADALGMRTALVLSGKTRRDDALLQRGAAAFCTGVYADIGTLPRPV